MNRFSPKWRNHRFLQSVAKCPLTDLAFFAGSGVSVPSGLPSADRICSALGEFLLPKGKQRRNLFQLTTPIWSSDGIRVPLRFERLIQVVRDTVDPELNILRCLESSKEPTALHFFLAKMIHDSVPVFTTNLDLLTERAYLKLSFSKPLLVIDREESTRSFRKSSFSYSYKVPRKAFLKESVLFKIHGSLRVLTRGSS